MVSRIRGRSYYPRGWQGSGMPLRKYFLGVGGVLLALLFAADALLPKPPVTGIASEVEMPRIRIHSERKGPEAIVFDTAQPTIVVRMTARPEATVAEANVASPEVASLARDALNSFAQITVPVAAQTAGSKPRKLSAKRPLPSHKREFAMPKARYPMRSGAENAGLKFFNMNW
jgi:hypothetical protein